jgi:hypothetical protein
LKANKVNLFVSSVLCVFWYHSPNVLDTLHICNISWLRVKFRFEHSFATVERAKYKLTTHFDPVTLTAVQTSLRWKML